MTAPISFSGAASAPAGAAGGDGAELRKAAQAFEAVILRQMLASMRQAKLGDDLFGSSATDTFREMGDARMADSIAAMRQFGIADLVERQFSGASGHAGGDGQ
ncbi:MAG: peptidoglycan hydrolase [Alphaproteobacteria bacterium HGW-Alphaproteobacteria-13]|jgi:flagellar protein FlgJ|nr:MAG: peptidoglycan hydrolase [Alphaproteobacteria bacterium HGW-Alphaproteobacteria-13]